MCSRSSRRRWRPCRQGATLVLVAVGIEKPGNLGALARSADAAGADALVVADAATDPWSPNAIRASTGAVFTLPVVEATLDDVLALPLQRVAAVVGASTTHSAADLRPPDGARSSAPRTPASTSAGATPPTSQVSIPMHPRSVDSLNTVDGGRDPALRSRAPAWLTPDPSDPRRRRAGARHDRGTPAAHAAALEPHARRPAQVRALPAHRLVQVPRRAQQALQPDGRGESRRRDRDQRRQPRPGRRVRRRRRRLRRTGRDVAGRVRAEDRRDARLRRDGRPRGDRSDRRLRAPGGAPRRDRTHARPSRSTTRSSSPAPAPSGSRSWTTLRTWTP